MKYTKMSLALLLSGLFSHTTVHAEIRTYVLSRAILDPHLPVKILDTTNPDHGLTASGLLLIDDEKQQATRDLKICHHLYCVELKNHYQITAYSNGGGVVMLQDIDHFSNQQMTLIWNYKQIGLIETLPYQWRSFSGKVAALSWLERDPSVRIGDDYRIENLRLENSGALSFIKGSIFNTSYKKINAKIWIKFYKNNVYIADGVHSIRNINPNTYANFEVKRNASSFDKYELNKIDIEIVE